MKILIIGNGAREYSIALALKKDARVGRLYFANGNGATTILGENIKAKSNDEIVAFCVDMGISLVVVGSEQPLIDGLSDALRKAKIRVFAPSQKAAQLEGSKIFMKNLLQKYKIPTARFCEGSDKATLEKFIDEIFGDSSESHESSESNLRGDSRESDSSDSRKSTRIVLKADGLCAGKGVLILDSKDSAKQNLSKMLNGELFGNAGKRVIIEEYLDGFELSVFAICDGRDYIVLPVAQDHKRLLDNDNGPNTGGMGAYAPTPLCDGAILAKIKSRIIAPTLEAMKNEDAEFCGVLFCGIMVVRGEPFVLEFNVRFGDPECEVILPLLETPLLDILNATVDKNLRTLELKIAPKYCVGVVMASQNYPFGTSIAQEIKLDGIETTSNATNHISFAGVESKNNALFASGGRVLVCVGMGESLRDAQDCAYNLTKKVHFKGAKMRNDIANKALR